jgi:hypothetical protein
LSFVGIAEPGDPNVSPRRDAVRSGTLGVMTTRERLQELADQICCSMRRPQRPAEPPVRGCPAFAEALPSPRAAGTTHGETQRPRPEDRAAS